MQFTFNKIIYLLWGMFFAYWFISSLFNRSKIAQRETLPSRVFYLTFIGLAISLVAFDPLFYGPLLGRFLPDGIIIKVFGAGLLILGLAFAVWARLHLGRYWSARITLAEDHRLIQTGPYRIVRNPIYCGGLVAMIGTAIIIGEVRGIIALSLVLMAFLIKINLEERWLLERFGEAYRQYRKKVKALIPFIY